MTISASIIKDSINTKHTRLTTMKLRYPRFIHSEFMTHRVFSRNASSSRAIPVEKLIKDCIDDPVYPSFWGKNKPGMQATEEMTLEEQYIANKIWANARDSAINHAQQLIKIGAHKQIANRILEPFSHINVLMTSTDWYNFYKLRCHKDAQPEFKILADQMQELQNNNTPKLLQDGEWHIPFVSKMEIEELPLELKLKISAARAARVSYLTHDNKLPKIEEDLKLFDRLAHEENKDEPLHASPLEHQAKADAANYQPWQSGNFTEFNQFRKLFEAGMIR